MFNTRCMRRRAAAAPLLAWLLLAGCATNDQPAIDEAIRLGTRHAGADAGAGGSDPRFHVTEAQRAAARDEISRLLARPLSSDDAMRIALLGSPSLQALIAGRAEAHVQAVRAGRPANPVFAFERLVRGSGSGEEVEIGRLLSVGLFDLLSWPARGDIADAQTRAIRLRVAGDVVATARDVRGAWVQAVAAVQAARYFTDVHESAQASAELAARMQSKGNFSRLQRSREQAFLADAGVQLARARHAQVAARERLVRLLGLDAAQASSLKLPERLPDVPPQPRAEPDVTREAMDRRLDMQLAMAELDATARRHGLARTGRWFDGARLGVARNSETGRPSQRGFEIEVPLPVFDGSDSLDAEARAAWLHAFNRTAQVAVDARSAVAEAYDAYRTSFELARRYRDEIVPLHQAIAEENVLRYNAMQIGVFELLADARDRVATVIAALEAQRDFWLADAALQAALVGEITP